MNHKCKHCHSLVSDTEPHNCNATNTTYHPKDDGDFLMSAAIGYATDSALLGGLIGGNMLGGIVGDLLSGD